MKKPKPAAVAHPAYALGHSERELERLSAQARLIEPSTRQFFRDAGIAPGMRVLDVGSGPGDAAFLAAEFVGAEGEVVGTDRAPAAIAAARVRAKARALANVSFQEGDPTEISFERPFDAVVGRYVLTFVAEPAAMLRKLLRHLKPSGVIIFHEPDWSGVRSFPSMPLYNRCCRLFIESFERLGIEPHMGLKLHSAFTSAGLPAPATRMNTVVGGEADGTDWLTALADLIGALLPEIERLGLATAAEVQIGTLAERLRKEVATSGGMVVGRSEVGAWART
jgi:SAM-dependent methyltransferase